MMYIPMIRAMLTKLNPTVKTQPLQHLSKELGGAPTTPSKSVKQYSEELKGVNGREER